MDRPRIVLASTSPRRIDLLRQAGLECEVVSPDADETPRKNEKPLDLVTRLALAKARSAARSLSRKKGRGSGALIIAADTIVVEPRAKRILGKPRSRAEAIRMLASIQGATHLVLTGYCILELGPRGATHSLVRAVRSRVTMRPLSAAQIRAYVATGEPMDKAGSYAAQGIGMALIDRIEGSYANVVGLPICQLLRDLEDEFEIPVFEWAK